MRSFRVPGRIEVMGKHTDYAGGRSLVCAIDRGISVRWSPRTDAAIRVRDDVRREDFTTTLGPEAAAPRGSWGNYVAAVARRLSRDFPRAATGADIWISSDLPADAGLSSSSALVIAIALSLIETNRLTDDAAFRAAFSQRTDLAGYLGAVENGRPFGAFPGDEGVGTFGGSEDHTAILCCRRGFLSQFSYAPVVHERDIACDPSATFVIASSGITANKTGGVLEHYNRLSRATSVLLEIWNGLTSRADPTLAAALASSTDARGRLDAAVVRDAHGGFGPIELRNRLYQFAEESLEFVPAAASALAERDYERLGGIVDRSQELAIDLLANQVPETVALQRAAREHGALAASAFGGGFGGSVWALVHADTVPDFIDRWSSGYRARFPSAGAHAEFFATTPGDGAGTLSGL